jgi:hypothetical protein
LSSFLEILFLVGVEELPLAVGVGWTLKDSMGAQNLNLNKDIPQISNADNS